MVTRWHTARLTFPSGEWSDPCRGGGDIFVLSIGVETAKYATDRQASLSVRPGAAVFDGYRHALYRMAGRYTAIGIRMKLLAPSRRSTKDFFMETVGPISRQRLIYSFRDHTFNEQHHPTSVSVSSPER